jgi:hypothetical protein
MVQVLREVTDICPRRLPSPLITIERLPAQIVRGCMHTPVDAGVSATMQAGSP